MQRIPTFTTVGLTAAILAALVVGCSPAKSDKALDTAVGTPAAENAKIAITTTSQDARKAFVDGRDLFEQIRFHDAHERLAGAVAKDPNFAIAHYYLAITSPTTKEFLEHLHHAVALAPKASDGERLLILSLQSGANADPAKSLDYARQLVAKYPEDERAHANLANTLGAQQDYEGNIAELNRAIEIAPSYAPAYNSLGYAYRPVGKYTEAEKAFKKYIELVPGDPNPYDSYAELLMKTGRFDESIAQYRKALAIDSNFSGSRVGIASNLMLQGKHDQALAEAQHMYDVARDDGERRTAIFSRAVTYADAGELDQALKETSRLYAMGAKSGDTAAMAGDATAMGDILLESGRPDQALRRYNQSLDLVTSSGLSAEAKADTELEHHYNVGRVALKQGDIAKARSELAAYLEGATARHNDGRVREAHKLAGMIALQDKKYDQAIDELARGNQQDPNVLFLTSLAYQGKGDHSKAKVMSREAANMNTLPTLNYGFVRSKARKAAGVA